MSKIRVLLVDDEEDYVKTMAERMDMRDLQSTVALSGEAALEVLETDPPDVIVLDLRMPGMHGMEVLEKVKRDHPHIQVIILTGHGGEKEEREARRLGAFEYVQKPADLGSLVDTIQGAWRRSIQAAKEFIKDQGEEFDRSMTAAALAEGGMPDEARKVMEQAHGLAREARAEEAEAKRALKILLVDDEEDYVRTMAERLKMRDLGSDVALNGEEALAMLEGELPDVMVLDLKMPGIGGLEVLEAVKGRYPSVQVIILTGHGSEKERAEALRLGAFAYLQKPVDIQDLMAEVRRAGEAVEGKE
ncbi:MAG: response regulator [Gemmatimonadota bacterium]|jgi:DNA-binding NtrC family response regulator